METKTLYRPVGPTELRLIAASGWKEFPPRLPEQAIFYPVLNEEYAAQIAERWNVRESGAGYVTAFEVDADYVAKFEVQQVGGREHLELWVPAEELVDFNRHIVGLIRVVREFGPDGPDNQPKVQGAATDEYLASVTIGPREPLNGPINLAPHDPAWASKFAELAERVRDALGDSVLRLEHVGSTSVPGLSAKPVIDMVLAVRDSTDESAYIPPLERHGFALRVREPDWFEHRLLKTAERDANLHVFTLGCAEIERMIVFRDWLRTHDDDRQKYEAVKRALAAKIWRHVQNYADAKSEVVREILERAGRLGV